MYEQGLLAQYPMNFSDRIGWSTRGWFVSQQVKWTLVLGALLVAVPASAQPAWEREKGNCDALLQSPGEALLADLRNCLGLWEAYRSLDGMDAKRRQAAAQAFQRVYKEGDVEARHLAKAALGRLGFSPETEDPNAPRPVADAKRKKYRAHTASDADRKAAVESHKRGMDLFGRKQWREAIVVFQDGLAKDPASVQLLYDVACASARDGNRTDAVEYLVRLSDLATADSIARLKKARTDSDFEAMRDEPGFKRATGYAKVKVLNGMQAEDKDLGEESVFKLVEVLRTPKLGWVVEEGGEDKHSRAQPHIWFKAHSKIQAYILMKLLGHPRVRLVPIDWDTQWDLIVSWADTVEMVDGEKVAKNSFGRKDKNGNDPTKRLDGALKSQDDALAKPDEYVAKADKVLAAPQQSVDSVTKTMDQVKGIGEKAGKAVDAVKGLGKIKF